MKSKKQYQPDKHLIGEQVVEKKLMEMNELLSKVDLSKLPKRHSAGQK